MSQRPDTRSAATQLFDRRTVVAVLFAGSGIVLTVIGLVATDATDLAKAGGVNINLWSGLVMLATAVLFALWAWRRALRPFRADIDSPSGPPDQT